jgi:transposase, IS5 family
LVRRYVVSDASVHESQKFEDVLDTSNTASDVADSAYRNDEIEEKLAERGLKSRIHRRVYRNRKLSEAQKAANTTRSKVRARVEHVFGDQKNGMRAELVRTIGIVRARCKIGMTNLVYNMRRFVCLERMVAKGRPSRRTASTPSAKPGLWSAGKPGKPERNSRTIIDICSPGSAPEFHIRDCV